MVHWMDGCCILKDACSFIVSLWVRATPNNNGYLTVALTENMKYNLSNQNMFHYQSDWNFNVIIYLFIYLCIYSAPIFLIIKAVMHS